MEGTTDNSGSASSSGEQSEGEGESSLEEMKGIKTEKLRAKEEKTERISADELKQQKSNHGIEQPIMSGNPMEGGSYRAEYQQYRSMPGQSQAQTCPDLSRMQSMLYQNFPHDFKQSNPYTHYPGYYPFSNPSSYSHGSMQSHISNPYALHGDIISAQQPGSWHMNTGDMYLWDPTNLSGAGPAMNSGNVGMGMNGHHTHSHNHPHAPAYSWNEGLAPASKKPHPYSSSPGSSNNIRPSYDSSIAPSHKRSRLE